MTPEAKLEKTEHGLVPKGEGWYVLNVLDAAWRVHERFGAWCNFEGDARFKQMGINLHVLWPGQPNCHYHAESAEESFLVLSGECLLLVNGEERRLRPMDFVHCAPGTLHVFVGAGDGPCAIIMTGARAPHDADIFYPRDELALRHRAGVPEDTPDPKVSYANIPVSKPCRAAWPPPAHPPRP